jgi:AraC-like DNA-binding protein
MKLSSRHAAGGPAVRATYRRSRVPGLYCSTLVDEGPPRARIHDRLVLFTLVAGEALVRCRGEVHALRPGALLLIEPGEVHRDLQKTPYRAVMMVLHAELAKSLRGPDAGRRLGPVVTWSPELCANTIALVAAVREDEAPDAQERHAASIFRSLLPLWTHRAPSPEPPLVTRVRRAFAESSEALVSLDELAGRLRCAPSYLCRVFADHMGLAPHSYQLQQRLLQARALMESGRTVAAAAQLTGFHDESHLRRHFCRRFAAAPGRYHKELVSDHPPEPPASTTAASSAPPSPRPVPPPSTAGPPSGTLQMTPGMAVKSPQRLPDAEASG